MIQNHLNKLQILLRIFISLSFVGRYNKDL